jgi:hypothetical protein
MYSMRKIWRNKHKIQHKKLLCEQYLWRGRKIKTITSHKDLEHCYFKPNATVNHKGAQDLASKDSSKSRGDNNVLSLAASLQVNQLILHPVKKIIAISAAINGTVSWTKDTIRVLPGQCQNLICRNNLSILRRHRTDAKVH